MKTNRAGERVVIVGAGVAGLCCALRLQEKNIPYLILEASDAPGGRVRTDKVDGFLLDRGFQVLLTAYPEARRLLDYKALRLRSFLSGALVRKAGKFHRVSDPRDPMINAFFRPFFGGIFLETELATSSRMFEFVFRMFSEGKAALPAAGMEAIPRQLASRLAPDLLRLNARVETIGAGEVRLVGGERVPAAAVVLATEGTEAARLMPELHPPGWHDTACLYYAAAKPPIQKPMLVLNGEGKGAVDNLCVPSNVAPTYAPAGQALVSATVVGASGADEKDLESEVRKQLTSWFGPEVGTWKHLRTYRICQALPARKSLEPAVLPVRRNPGLYICGDHRETPSLQGAMVSGRRAAEAVVEDWGRHGL